MARHTIAVLPIEKEKVRQFMRGLIYPIGQSILWVARDGSLFQSVISTAKEVELMQREEFGDPKRLRTLG